MVEQGLIDDFDDPDWARLTDDCVAYTRDSAPPAYPPMDMPRDGEAVLAWTEIRFSSIPAEMLQRGAQLFEEHGVTDVWRQLFGDAVPVSAVKDGGVAKRR